MPPSGWPTLLAERGDLDGLRARADAGDGDAARRLAGLLAERGDLDGLRARADAGDGDAARRLAELLAERGDLDGAAQILRARADAGDGDAAGRLADLLAERGDLDEAARPGRRRRRACRPAAGRAAGRARRPGRAQILRARADAGDGDAAWQLAELLAERGDLDGLRARADAGDGTAAWRLAELLAERGDLDGAARPGRRRRRVCRPAAGRAAGRARRPGRGVCAPGPTPATGMPPRRLAELLAERGDLDGLRARADAGDGDAAARLADLLIKQGRSEEAERLRRFGLNPDGSIACA